MLSTEEPNVSALSIIVQSQLSQSAHPTHYQNLALQVQYNLQYQHNWTSLRIHALSPISQQNLPRPLLSGLPPHRIYVHPDDQVEELKRGVKDSDVEVEREWILPTNLKEKWSLRSFAEIFDAIGDQPQDTEEKYEEIFQPNVADGVKQAEIRKKRRGGKRLLLATLGDDSTVVYYIVHDGIVKPRQN